MSSKIFENIDFENLKNLYELSIKGYNDISDIKINYLKNFTNLQENLNFLLELNIFKISGNKILTNKNQSKNFKEILIDNIFKNNLYFQEIKEYFQNFSLDNENKYSFEPDENYNFLSSDVRNFLISAILLKNIDTKYIITDEVIFNKFKKKKISPSDLENILIQKKIIGLAAEKLVFKEEREKVKKIDENLVVEHVSLKDVSLGYDIESFNEKGEKIFIEVKAISTSNFRFYLSANEYTVSNKLKDKYYLYLLPKDLTTELQFDYNKLQKINNIKDNIFQNNNWIIESDNFLIHKKN